MCKLCVLLNCGQRGFTNFYDFLGTLAATYFINHNFIVMAKAVKDFTGMDFYCERSVAN